MDTEVEDPEAIPPLINLDFKIVKGDSLVSKICGFEFDLETQLSGKVKRTEEQVKLMGLRGKYNDLKLKYAEAMTVAEKDKLRKEIDKTRRESLTSLLPILLTVLRLIKLFQMLNLVLAVKTVTESLQLLALIS